MLDAELRERVDDRVRDRRQPRRDATFAAAAHTEWVRRRRHFADLRVETGQQVGAWQCVIQEGPGQKLAGAGIVYALLPQRLADPLRDAAVALAMDPIVNGLWRLGTALLLSWVPGSAARVR